MARCVLPSVLTWAICAVRHRRAGPVDEFVAGADGHVTEWIYRVAGVEFRSRRVP